MRKERPIKFEKADINTLRLILERTEDVPVALLLSNKQQLEEKLAEIQKVLKNVNDMLAEANKLGLVPKEEPKPEVKPTSKPSSGKIPF